MTDETHDLMRDMLPDLAAGKLDAAEAARLERRLAEDPHLKAEYDVVLALRQGRPEPPAELGARIRADLAEARAPRGWAGWPLSAAAVLVLALGTAVLWQGGEPEVPEGTSVPEEPMAAVFPADDGLIAGALVLSDLTDAELEALLEELGG